MITGGCRRLSSFSACSFHLASTSCLLIFFSSFSYPSSRSETTNDPSSPPPIVVGTPADDRLTFGLMALAGSRRWWMTVGERETFGAIRRFKRFFVTGARYVAAPAWPATMRQKQCWLIAFQNCERWKTVPGHPMVAATFLRTAPDVPRFLSRVRAGWGVFEERRFDSRKSQLNQVACDRCSRSKKRSLSRSSDDESRWFVHFSRGIHFVSKNGGSPLYFISTVEFVIYFSFFFLFILLFSRGVWNAKMRTSLSSSVHLDRRISPWNNSIAGAENKPYYSSGSG